jgi:hypothetical protein
MKEREILFQTSKTDEVLHTCLTKGRKEGSEGRREEGKKQLKNKTASESSSSINKKDEK